METEKGMRSIWFFVGLIMLAIGILVFLAGIYELINPTVQNIKLTRSPYKYLVGSINSNYWFNIYCKE